MELKTKKFLAAFAVLLLLTIGVGVGVYHNFQDLQARNFNAAVEAQKAIDEHDLETFNRYVDTNALIDRAASEILTAHINETLSPNDYSMDQLRMRYDSLKPEFVDAATQALAEYIIAGKVTFPADATETQKFLQKSGVTSCKVVSISKPRKDGNRQVVVVVLNNTAMKFSFDLELELTHDAEGNWRITDARGFEDYYYGWRRSLRRKLDSLNAPIANRMDEIFAVKSFKAKVAEGDEYGFSQTIDITITAEAAC